MGKHRRDARVAGGRETHADVAAIRAEAFAPDEAGFFQVIDDHGDVAAALEVFLRQLALVQRAEVPQCFEDAELTDGQALGGQMATGPCDHRTGGSHQFDEGIESTNLVRATLVMRGHGSK